MPSFAPTCKRKRIPEEDDEVMEDEADEGGLDQSENTNTGQRGTVLVTLRNVAPYTEW
jgi:25S rRNA (uracil2634-N3)-methyltransferase